MTRATRQMRPVMSFPPLPLCLIKDEIELPERYQPCEWAHDLVKEWQAEERLVAAGAYPTLSILLVGSSGVGKTTAARWIASQLRAPAFSLLLSGTIDSYMGATGKSIESAIRYAMDVRCVLLLDELDAVAASRNSKHDVGEIWRVTNTFIKTSLETASIYVAEENVAIVQSLSRLHLNKPNNSGLKIFLKKVKITLDNLIR